MIQAPNYKIPNHKHQITNKSQIPIFNHQDRFGILNFGHCNLFDIWDLRFEIFNIPVFQFSCRSHGFYGGIPAQEDTDNGF
jgi:hypothetical protein